MPAKFADQIAFAAHLPQSEKIAARLHTAKCLLLDLDVEIHRLESQLATQLAIAHKALSEFNEFCALSFGPAEIDKAIESWSAQSADLWNRHCEARKEVERAFTL